MFLKSVISAATAVNIKYLKIQKTDFCHISIHQPPSQRIWGHLGRLFFRKLTLKSNFWRGGWWLARKVYIVRNFFVVFQRFRVLVRPWKNNVAATQRVTCHEICKLYYSLFIIHYTFQSILAVNFYAQFVSMWRHIFCVNPI